MTQELVPFDGGALPANMDYARRADDAAPMVGGSAGPAINKIKCNKQRQIVFTVDGQDYPVPSPVRIVIERHTKGISRTWWEARFDRNAKPTPPDCFSVDGDKPSPKSKRPPAANCAQCPMSVRGERGMPCKQVKRLAVTFYDDEQPGRLYQLDNSPTSTFGNDRPNEMLFNLKNFDAQLRERGINEQIVVVELHADDQVDYEKLLYKPVGYLTAEQYTAHQATIDQDELERYTEFDFNTSPAQSGGAESASAAAGHAVSPPAAPPTAQTPPPPATSAPPAAAPPAAAPPAAAPPAAAPASPTPAPTAAPPPVQAAPAPEVTSAQSILDEAKATVQNMT